LATAADIVADPSAPDAFVNGIMEGVEWVWNQDKLVAMQVEEMERQVEKAARNKKLNEQKKLQMFERFINEISKV